MHYLNIFCVVPRIFKHIKFILMLLRTLTKMDALLRLWPALVLSFCMPVKSLFKIIHFSPGSDF